jgi:ribonuclease P protein component
VPQPSARFPKSARLLKHPSFQTVYKTGARHFSPLLTAFYLLTPSDVPSARIGITVSRALGKAVVRNRIRRRVREAVRTSLAPLSATMTERQLQAEVVLNPKKVCEEVEFPKLKAEVERAFAAIAKAKQKGAAQA